MERKFVSILILLILAVSSVPILHYLSNQTEANNVSPTSSPIITEKPVPSYKSIMLIFPSLDPADYGTTNVTQGASFQQNLTVLSKAEIQIQIPLSLKLTGYNNSAYSSAIPQDRIFNYTFNPNLLVINPDESQSSIITVEVANDAPLGLYVLNIELGNASLTHLSGHTFFVSITA